MYIVKVLIAQSCPTLCNPKDCSPPDSSVHGILQAKILQWVVIPFFRGSSGPRDQTWVSLSLFFFYQLEANHLTILQWPLTWIHMHSPSRSPLPPPSPPNPSGSSQCTRSEHLSHASNLGWRSVSP